MPKSNKFYDDDTRALPDRVAAVFSPDGPIAGTLPCFRPRGGQVEFARAVAEAIETGSTLVAEAGTGTGKTFAYLAPALLAGKTCIISTAGKSLQDQLFSKDLPALRKALNIPLNAALLKGRSNYICLYRMELVEAEGRYPERDSYLKFRKIQRFAAVSQTGDKGELDEVPEDDKLWPMVTSTRENCLGRDRCPHWEDCFVRRAREQALKSQVVVVNHHLYLSSLEIKGVSDAIEGILPKAELTVIDEAHQLPGIASNFFGTSFSTYAVENIAADARALGLSKVRDGAAWDALHQAVLRTLRELRLSLTTIGLLEGDRRAVSEIERFPEIYPDFSRACEAFDALGAALKENAGRNNDLDALYDYHCEVSLEMDKWRQLLRGMRDGKAAEKLTADDKGKSGRAVLWVEALKSGVRFNNTPLEFSDQFREMREKEGGAWVFTSATLSSAGDFTHFCKELGIKDAPAHTWESPFAYYEQGCFYLPDLPPPANNTAEHTRRVVDTAWPLIRAAGGRTFVLCTSLAGVQEAAEALRGYLQANGSPYPLLVQGDLPKNALLERFRAAGNAVLVGSMSFWEGVDVRGEALSLVVIDKIPFSPPDDPVNSARAEALKEQGLSPFFVQTLPEAVIALKQGAGRLIRSETDRGMLVLCDSRVLTKRYGSTILRSLPDFYRTRRPEKALEFFLNPAMFQDGLYSD